MAMLELLQEILHWLTAGVPPHEKGRLAGIDSNKRAFGPPSSVNPGGDKTGVTELEVQTPPPGATFKWVEMDLANNVLPAPAHVKFDTPNNFKTRMQAMIPGPARVGCEIRHGNVVEPATDNYTTLSVPLFVVIKEDLTQAEGFDKALAGYHLTARKGDVVTHAKEVAESLYSTLNVRLIWQIANAGATVEQMPNLPIAGLYYAQRVLPFLAAWSKENLPNLGYVDMTLRRAAPAARGFTSLTAKFLNGVSNPWNNRIVDVYPAAIEHVLGDYDPPQNIPLSNSAHGGKAALLVGRWIGTVIAHEAIAHAILNYQHPAIEPDRHLDITDFGGNLDVTERTGLEITDPATFTFQDHGVTPFGWRPSTGGLPAKGMARILANHRGTADRLLPVPPFFR